MFNFVSISFKNKFYENKFVWFMQLFELLDVSIFIFCTCRTNKEFIVCISVKNGCIMLQHFVFHKFVPYHWERAWKDFFYVEECFLLYLWSKDLSATIGHRQFIETEVVRTKRNLCHWSGGPLFLNTTNCERVIVFEFLQNFVKNYISQSF